MNVADFDPHTLTIRLNEPREALFVGYPTIVVAFTVFMWL